jgi:hypothetical protein
MKLHDAHGFVVDAEVGIAGFTTGKWQQIAAAVSTPAALVGAGAGAEGDTVVGLLVIPTTTSPGAVTLYDDTHTVVVFAGGSNSLTCLVPFFIPLGLKSEGSGWYVSTGAGLSVVATGDFT